MGHFTLVGLVSSPLSEREAVVDLVLIQTSLLFYGNYAQKMLVSLRTTCVKL